ncbi:MAG TPA: B-box zinc finger protein [Candidatus Bathyarchaeia archaeon]|nr:B-box zinc finger protein [Candidatus Bathyarchaeia archaeon]
MNCANHPDAPAVAYCRTCGKPLCNVCVRDLGGGAIACEQCLTAQGYAAPPPGAAAVPPPPLAVRPGSGPRPTLAAILGVIPGVGAMYNGEYAKGFVHVLIFAVLILMTKDINGLFGLGVAAFCVYMPIEAYKTARARELGLPAPDPFGFNALFGGGPPPSRPASTVATPGGAGPAAANFAPGAPNPPNPPYPPVVDQPHSRIPVGAVILIGLGVLFLLDEMDLLHFDRIIGRFWPLILIALGIRILMQRQRRGC